MVRRELWFLAIALVIAGVVFAVGSTQHWGTPKIGSDVTLQDTTGDGQTEMCATQADATAFARVVMARDTDGWMVLERTGKCWPVRAGMRVRLLDQVPVQTQQGGQVSMAQVRVLDGPYNNTVGYVPAPAIPR